ncbi:MAG TPA: hypothetical protein VF226_13665 [Hyphomicrobiaceae bacterium]
MTALLYDRVWETTTTTGTGSYTLDGAKSAAYRAFGDVLADNDYVEYFVRDSDASNWERVWGQYDAGNNTLTRNLIESSTGSLIDWGSGTKEVYIAPPAKGLNDEGGIYVGESRPAWMLANRLWLKPSTSTLYWYDGTGDREMGLVSGGSFIAKTPTTARGDIIRRGATIDERLAIGSAGQVLTSDGTDPVWSNLYTAGTWTPVLTFQTPGNLSVAYSTQVGTYVKVGSLVTATVNIQTSSFTHTTASGILQVTGLPFTSKNVSNQFALGSCAWQGITKASYTDVVCRIINNVTYIDFMISGAGQSTVQVVAGDVPSGGTVRVQTTICYEAA